MNSGQIHVVAAADEAYAMPLAAMLVSLFNNCTRPEALRVTIIDGGVREVSRRRLHKSLGSHADSLRWTPPPRFDAAALKVNGHVSATAYYRLMLGSILPADVHRCLYLDSDVVVVGDVAELWILSSEGKALLAVNDCIVPMLLEQPKYKQNRPKELPVGEPYFNSGVMLVDLDYWRRHEVEKKAMAFGKEEAKRILWWDQDCLNAVLRGAWASLDPNWNYFRNAATPSPPEEEQVVERALSKTEPYPRILHFVTHIKPWYFGYAHPDGEVFFHYLDKTDWCGWRPSMWRNNRLSEKVKILARRWMRSGQ